MTLAPGRTYRYFTGTPLYPFGWGLSYTTFSFVALDAVPFPYASRLTWSTSPAALIVLDIDNSNSSTVTVSLQNIGLVAGDEVSFIYFRVSHYNVCAMQVLQAYFSTTAIPSADPASALIKQLFNFQRISLTPAQATEQSFSFSANTFITYDADGDQVLYPGMYTVLITNGVNLVRPP